MIELELRDLLSTNLSAVAEIGDTTIQVASEVPDKCSLVITAGRAYPQLLLSEVVEVSANTSGVLTITASWYAGNKTSVADGNFTGLQANWPSGTEVLLLFNEMYYNEIRDSFNSLLTEDQSVVGTWDFQSGLSVTGRPDEGTAPNGSFRLTETGVLQAKQAGVWRDVLTTGLPVSTVNYGTIYFNPATGWTATNQLRTRFNATPASAPAMDADGEVSVKRKLTIWYSPEAYASFVADSVALAVSGLPINVEQKVTVDELDGNTITADTIITETVQGTEAGLNIRLVEPGTITIFDGSTTEVNLRVLSNNSRDLIFVDPETELLSVRNLHTLPVQVTLGPSIEETTNAQHDGLAIHTIETLGEDPIVNGSFDGDLDGWVTSGAVSYDGTSGSAIVATVSGIPGALGQLLPETYGSDTLIRLEIGPTDLGISWKFGYLPAPEEETVDVAIGGTNRPGVYIFSPNTSKIWIDGVPTEPPVAPTGDPWNFFLIVSGNEDAETEIVSVSMLLSDERFTLIEARGEGSNPSGQLGSEGFADIIEMASEKYSYSDNSVIAATETVTLGTVASNAARGAVAQKLSIDSDGVHLHAIADSTSGLNLTNHITVGPEIGTLTFGMIRYTEEGGFEGYYESSPGVGEWKSFRTENANLAASSPGHTIHYMSGNWVPTSLVKVFDERIELNTEVELANSIKIGNLGEETSPTPGTVRYNGDFEGYMELVDHNGNLSPFWVSLTASTLASGGNNGEMLVYNGANQKWLSALDNLLFLDNQLTIKGRLSARKGLTIPPADASLPGSTLGTPGDLSTQRWVGDHPVEWEEGTYPIAAPDGHWIRVLPASEGARERDLIQFWGVIGFETFEQTVGETTETETIPKYGWLNLSAYDPQFSNPDFPNPEGNEGKMLIVRSDQYQFIDDIMIPSDEDDPITLTRSTEVSGSIDVADDVTLAGDLRLTEEQSTVSLGDYDGGRSGLKEPEDFTWEMLRKLPTERSIEYFPGEIGPDGETIPLEDYGQDPSEKSDLVLQYHLTARETSPSGLFDGFQNREVTINNVNYEASCDQSTYRETFDLLLTAPLSVGLEEDQTIKSVTGVFAKLAADANIGVQTISAVRVLPENLPAFAALQVTVGPYDFTVTTTGSDDDIEVHGDLVALVDPEAVPALIVLDEGEVETTFQVGVAVEGPTGVFGLINNIVTPGATSFTIVPYTRPIVEGFGPKPLLVDVGPLDTEAITASTVGSTLEETALLTIEGGITSNVEAGDIVYLNDLPFGQLVSNYVVGATSLEIEKTYQPVETLRLTRRGNVFIGKDLIVGRNIVSDGPILLGDFNENNNTLQRGMIRFNGDFEGFTGTNWVSLTNRLANPQIPFPVVNNPKKAYLNGVLIGQNNLGLFLGTTFAQNISAVAEEGDVITFSNGATATVTGVSGVSVTIDVDNREELKVNGTWYPIQYVGNDPEPNTIILDGLSGDTLDNGTIVTFSNGAVARKVSHDTAAFQIDRTIAIFPQVDGDWDVERLKDNTLYTNENPLVTTGDEITFNDNALIATNSYPASTAERQIAINYSEMIGATLRYDQVRGWHYTDAILVNDSNVVLKETLTLGTISPDITPRKGMIMWDGDFLGYNGTAWVSLQHSGDQEIGAGQPGDTVVFGETEWQANAQVRFEHRLGQINSGVLKINNVLQLADWPDDEAEDYMDPSAYERGMIRYNGDLEFYTGFGWISLTDNYGLVGGRLPVPETETLGLTIRYVPGDPGQWVVTDRLVVGETGTYAEGYISSESLVLLDSEKNSNGGADPNGTIRFVDGDLEVKLASGWKSLTESLQLEEGEPGDTLFLFEDSVGNKTYWPTPFFKVIHTFSDPDDPSTYTDAIVEFDCNVNVKDQFAVRKITVGPDEAAWVHRALQIDGVQRYSISLTDPSLVVTDEHLVLTEESLTVPKIVSPEADFQSLIAQTAELLTLLTAELTVEGPIIATDHDQEVTGIPSLRIGKAHVGNYTTNAFECEGLASFSNTITVGDQKSDDATPGMIRFNGDFQGYDGEYWYSLTGKDHFNSIFAEGFINQKAIQNEVSLPLSSGLRPSSGYDGISAHPYEVSGGGFDLVVPVFRFRHNHEDPVTFSTVITSPVAGDRIRVRLYYGDSSNQYIADTNPLEHKVKFEVFIAAGSPAMFTNNMLEDPTEKSYGSTVTDDQLFDACNVDSFRFRPSNGIDPLYFPKSDNPIPLTIYVRRDNGEAYNFADTVHLIGITVSVEKSA